VSSKPATTVASALETCAQELSELSGVCQRLQAHLSPLLLRGADVEEAQALDVVTQSLGALADYLSALALDVPAEVQVDPQAAAAGLTLSALAARLTGAQASDDETSGDLDLFGAS
jgi:hypothetical protein